MTAAEFDKNLQDGTLVLTLAGMSNAGKSYWSDRLAQEAGFESIGCDDLIEAELGGELKELGYEGINDMAKWLGQPYDEQFAANEQTYLNLETGILERIIKRLEQGLPERNTVIDTTGSVVHTSSEISRKLRRLTTVVYLETPENIKKEMFKLYIAEPKPVVWGDLYKPEPGETSEAALIRSYPELLAYRSRLYREMAEVTISREVAMSFRDTDEFLRGVKEALPA